MFEAMAIGAIYMLWVLGLLFIVIALYYCGVCALYLMYKRNGGRYGLRKFMRTRGLDL